MEALTLARSDVLRSGDVTTAREKARQHRLRNLAIYLTVIAIPVAIKTWIDVGRYVAGDGAKQSFRWPVPHFPPWLLNYMPALVLIVVLMVGMVFMLVGAGRSPHVLYRPEELDVRLSDVKGAGVVVEEVVKTLNLFLAYKTFKDRM